MNVRRVPTHDVTEVAAAMELLDTAPPQVPITFDRKDMWEHVRNGHMQLWVAEVDGTIIGAMATQITRHANGIQVLDFLVLVGDDMEAWLPTLPLVEQWAKLHGATYSRIIGRPGFRRVLAPAGYKSPHTYLVKEL